MTATLALAGDTMLGRNVAAALDRVAPTDLVDEQVARVLRNADLTVLNLECCVSDRGEPWPDPRKPFFFRAPPAAVETLCHLGVDAVTLANNHALDYGPEALLDTLAHLHAAGIVTVGAGEDVVAARRPARLAVGDHTLTVVGVTDHPRDFAAGPDRPGVAYAELGRTLPDWLEEAATDGVTLVTPHWGPNMVAEPVRHVRAAADALLDAGADLVAGHSAHVFHGVRWLADPPRAVLYDLGDFLDDYAVHPELRNDLGLVWLVTLGDDGPTAVEAVPVRLRPGRTELADGTDRAWIAERLAAACHPLSSTVEDAGDRLRVAPG